jgi:hypothetical protein
VAEHPDKEILAALEVPVQRPQAQTNQYMPEAVAAAVAQAHLVVVLPTGGTVNLVETA